MTRDTRRATARGDPAERLMGLMSRLSPLVNATRNAMPAGDGRLALYILHICVHIMFYFELAVVRGSALVNFGFTIIPWEPTGLS